MKLNALTVGTGPRHVVFLHGLFGQGKNWGSIATALADIATCHLVDLPNHGLSPWTEEFDLDEQADLVAGWLRENVPTPVVLIGHSLGGKIAMRLALRHQGLVDRLMVVDISPAISLLVLMLLEVGGWFAIHSVYDGPVVWVNGGRSPYVQPEHVEPMRALFPRVRQVTLKRAGHWVHADDPSAFVQVCRLFLEAP